MLKQIPLKEAEGKVLVGSSLSTDCQDLILVFEDKTFSHLRAITDGQGGTEVDLHTTFYENDFSDKALINAGFYKPEELREIRAAEEASKRKEQVERDQAEFERLRIKLLKGGNNQ